MAAVNVYCLKHAGSDCFAFCYWYDDDEAKAYLVKNYQEAIKSELNHFTQPGVFKLVENTIVCRLCTIENNGDVVPCYSELTQVDPKYWQDFVQQCRDEQEEHERQDEENKRIKEELKDEECN